LKIANDLRVVGAIATEDDWLVSDVVLIEVFVNETKENLLLLIDQAIVAIMGLALLAFEHAAVSVLHALAAILGLLVVLFNLDHGFVAFEAGPLDTIILRACRIRTQLKVDD